MLKLFSFNQLDIELTIITQKCIGPIRMYTAIDVSQVSNLNHTSMKGGRPKHVLHRTVKQY